MPSAVMMEICCHLTVVKYMENRLLVVFAEITQVCGLPSPGVEVGIGEKSV